HVAKQIEFSLGKERWIAFVELAQVFNKVSLTGIERHGCHFKRLASEMQQRPVKVSGEPKGHQRVERPSFLFQLAGSHQVFKLSEFGHDFVSVLIHPDSVVLYEV